MTIITASEVSFDRSTPVISSAMKLVLPAGSCAVGEGQHLVFKTGAEVTYEEPVGSGTKVAEQVGGKPMRDYPYRPENQMPHPWGVLVENKTDGQVQGLSFDGSRVMIVNNVTREKAVKIFEKIQALNGSPDSSRLSPAQFGELISFIHGMQLGDTYTSDDAFIKKHFTLVDVTAQAFTNARGNFGWMKRDARDICSAVFIPGDLSFQGMGSAAPQRFPYGAVIVRKGNIVDGVQPDIFLRDYQHADGGKIRAVEQIAELIPRQ